MSNSVFTKNNQVKPAVRERIYEKVVADHFQGWTVQPNGELTLEVGSVEGRVINAIVKPVISPRTNFEKKTAKKKEVETQAVDLSTLFD